MPINIIISLGLGGITEPIRALSKQEDDLIAINEI